MGRTNPTTAALAGIACIFLAFVVSALWGYEAAGSFLGWIFSLLLVYAVVQLARATYRHIQGTGE